MVQIYVSSTFKDLEDHRRAVIQGIDRLEGCQVVAMENYTAYSERPLDKCRRDVQECDIYVGLFAWRHGFCPEGQDKSITCLECEAAREKNLPRLIFLMDEEAEWPHRDPDDAAIRQLRDRLADESMVDFFSTDTSELRAKVVESVVNHLGLERTRIEIPPLLPYLSDRSVQREELEEALDLHSRERATRPVFVAFDGDEREAHDRFVDRMELRALPQLLDGKPVLHKRLAWCEPGGSVKKRLGRLLKRLAADLTGKSAPDSKELALAISNARRPVMVSTFVSSRDWQSDDAEVIQEWIRWWEDFPDLETGQLLSVLSVRYQGAESGSATGLLDKIGGWSRSRRERARIEAMSSVLDGLDLESRTGVAGVRFSTLTAIRFTDVENWIDREVESFCAGVPGTNRAKVVADRLKDSMRERFEARSRSGLDDAFPMRELAKELRTQLNQCLNEGELV